MDLKEEKIFYNALAIKEQNAYQKIAGLKKIYGSWAKAWEKTEEGDQNIDPHQKWEELEKSGIELFLIEETGYPPLLREISWPPLGIYVLGSLPPANPTLAIVGTRKATSEGKDNAKFFASELAKNGLCIVSGLALGIDGAAHEGCLEAEGRTIAVLGNGLHKIYPSSHERIAKRILEKKGAIVSEYPPGSPTLPYHFLERNRIISGLSNGTLIIEAPRESASLTTARFAMEQNREVFVLPGPHTHPNFTGSHALIRSGAELVTSPDHILESLGIEGKSGKKNSAQSLFETEEEKKILEALRSSALPLTIDKIIELTDLEVHIANQALSFLVIKNVARENEAGYTLN